MKFLLFRVMPLLLLPVLSIAQTQPFNGEALLEDTRYLQQALYEIHPSPFRYNSRDSIDHLFATLETIAGSGMSLLAFEQEINKILDKVLGNKKNYILKDTLQKVIEKLKEKNSK